MKSTETVSHRRRLARLVVAGAIAAIPLAALAVPASAEITLDTEITEVKRPHHDNDRFPWENRAPWENRDPWDSHFDNDRTHWDDDDCDRHGRGHDRDNNQWRNVLPRGSFGSS